MTERTYGLTRLVGHGYAFTERLRPSSPAAGAGFTYKGDGRYWEMLDSISFKLATSATAGSRQVTLTLTDADGSALVTVPQTTATAASQTAIYSYLWNMQTEQGSTNGPYLNVLPQVFMQPDMSFVVTVGGVQTGDQVSGIRVVTQRFVTGPQGYLTGVVDTERETPEVLELIGTYSP